jgi:hypothetical protein
MGWEDVEVHRKLRLLQSSFIQANSHNYQVTLVIKAIFQPWYVKEIPP